MKVRWQVGASVRHGGSRTSAWPAGLVVTLILAASPGRAGAQAADEPQAARVEEAKALFTAGRVAFEGGRFADALRYFQQSYDLSQRPALLYNIGLAHDRLRDDDEALKAFEAYLAALPDAENRIEVETRAQALREGLARRAQGLPPAPTPAETAAAAPQAEPAASASTRETADAPPSHSILTRWWFWTVVGVAVAGGITAGVVVASGGDTKTEAPLQPRSGVVVTTLGVSP